MFLTVTLNPALDKTLHVARNAPGETLRAARVINLAGGKGVNVARALVALGGSARTFVPLGGHSGAHLADLARAEGLEVASVPVAGDTRTALTIRVLASGRALAPGQAASEERYWHYLEPGPELQEQEITRLREGYLWALEGCNMVVISGSLPCAGAATLLPWMVRAARERGLRVALDSFGALSLPALEAGPWMAKPNLHEWEMTTGDELETDPARKAALRQMEAWGIELAVLSMGDQGALALARGVFYRIAAPHVEEINDLGGGDSMVAGICWAASQEFSLRECLAWGAACGAANAAVWDPGGIDRGVVEQLLRQVQVLPV